MSSAPDKMRCRSHIDFSPAGAKKVVAIFGMAEINSRRNIDFVDEMELIIMAAKF